MLISPGNSKGSYRCLLPLTSPIPGGQIVIGCTHGERRSRGDDRLEIRPPYGSTLAGGRTNALYKLNTKYLCRRKDERAIRS
jgi:hypothetical protein